MSAADQPQPITSDVPAGMPAEPLTPEAAEWRENLAKLAAQPQKSYPRFAHFCDNAEEIANAMLYPNSSNKVTPVGFKPARVAKWLAENEHFKTDRKTDILYYGDEAKGVWSRDGETKLREIVTKILGEEDKAHHYANILHTLKGLTYTDVEFSRKIAVENGLLDVETGEFTQASLEEMAFYKIPTTYNKEADCPNFKEFLKQILAPEDILTLQEWSGFLLLPDYREHKIMWLHGSGRNGKGVWTRTMEGILGAENCSSVPLEQFDGYHRFAMERLYGKLFNTCNEPTVNSKKVLQTSLLKAATGQDMIEAEIKCKQKTIKFRNTAKITVIANRFPKVEDNTTAFKERRLFITFPHEYIGKDKISNLEEVWLKDPTERSGILNWMLEGLQRLLAQGYFTEGKTQQETEILFQRASDTIGAFITEMAIFNRNYVTTRREAYERYKEYCDVYGLDPENEKRFTQRLKETPKIKATTTRGERKWKGITFKTFDDEGNILSGADGADGARVLYPAKITEGKILEEYNTSAPAAPCAPDSQPSVFAKDCINFHKSSCTHPNPNCLTPLFNCPDTCRGFKPYGEGAEAP